MAKRALVLIPYRQRETHLECLVGQLQRHWPELTIAVIKQADEKSWNKGLLFNVGYKLLATDYDYIILSDVDFIPVWDQVDYGSCKVPCMVAGAASQFSYKLYYPTFFGGVVICSKEHYELVNGFSNKFKGYGGEDDSFRNSFLQKGITPSYKMGRFECFAHPKPDIRPGSQFYKTSEYQNNLKMATAQRDFSDGLSNCTDYIDIELSTKPRDNSNGYIHIKVHTNE